MRIQKTWTVRGFSFVALISLLLSSVLSAYAQDAGPAGGTNALSNQAQLGANAAETAPFAPGEILVGFRRDVVRASSVLAELRIQAVEALDLRGLDGSAGDAGIEGQLLHVPEGTELAAIQQLLQDPSVAFAVPNSIVYAAADSSIDTITQPETPFNANDPLYADRQWYLQRINASRAWALAYATDGFQGQFSSVRVGIVDSGVDFEHPELKSRLLEGGNYVTPGEEATDDCGHGTDVAGLVGAILNNKTGIVGVAPEVEIAPYKVLHNVSGRCLGTISAVAAAIRQAADDESKVINLSLESSSPNVVMESAIKYAYDKGALLIAAVGNGYPASVQWPAAYAEVMGVAATNYIDRHATYSNAGSQVEIAAPGGEIGSNLGVKILSTWPGGVYCRDIDAPLPESGYCTSEGTSMAAAIVSGAAAFVMSVRPDLTGAQVRQLLRNTATRSTEGTDFVGSGRLDVHAALRHGLPTNLQLAYEEGISRQIPLGAAPYTITVRVDNSSLSAINWQATVNGADTWLTMRNPDADNADMLNRESQAMAGISTSSAATIISGTTEYGDPGHISLTISPTHLITGSYVATLKVVGTRADSSIISQTVGIGVLIETQPFQYYFPLVLGANSSVTSATTEHEWEMPVNINSRTTYSMSDESDVDITLPITFTLREQAYTSARIFSNGYLDFGNADAADHTTGSCLPNLGEPNDAVYGWWADLNPGAAGAQVSTFLTANNRFVIEFDNVPTVASVSPAYRVSFQIVLYPNGNIGLNYGQAPSWGDVSMATVGVEAIEGRFYNQVACKDDQTELGLLPRIGDSLLFDGAEDIY